MSSAGKLAILGVAAGILLTSQHAYAYIDGGDTACGCVSAGWNAPAGAVISVRSEGGPITAVLTAIGEYYTHTMVSHGPGDTKWVSHTTMRTPGIYMNIFGDDDVALDELRYGYPGPSQINMGGAYKNVSGASAVKYTDGGSAGVAVSDYLWYSLPYCGNVSSGLCYYGVYSLQDSDYNYGVEYLYVIGRVLNGTIYRHSYGVYQYMDDHQVPEGDDMSDPGWAMQCSTFAAWSQARATGQVMTSTVYPTTVIGPAAYQLHSAVTDECDNAAGWFGGIFVDCSDIADQIVNCFTDFNNCADDRASTWQSIATTHDAVSISPDHVIGLAGHPNTNSIWAGKTQLNVQWNSGGQICGCWF